MPPQTAHSGLASFALRNFQLGAWTSQADGRWLFVENEANHLVEPGTVVVCTEGFRVVAYFHVGRVVDVPGPWPQGKHNRATDDAVWKRRG